MSAASPFHYASLAFLLATLLTAPARADNLLDSYQAALASDPAIAQARASLDADLQSKPLARSAWLPHMGLSAGAGKNMAGITGFGVPLSQTYDSNNVSVNLTQNLFNGQAWVALAQADHRIEASEAALVYAQQQLALKVAGAYFDVLQAEAQEQVAREQEKLLGAIGEQTRAALEVGTGDVIAVHEAQARLDAARSDLVKSGNAVTVARRTLQRLTHRRPGALDDLDSFEPLPPQPDQPEPWVTTALASQPLLHENEARLQTAREQVEFNRRARWPVVSLQGIAQHTQGVLLPGMDINQKGASINLSMPLFDGGQISATVDQAQAQAQAGVEALNGLRDDVTLATQTAFHDLEDSVAQLKAAQQAAASAGVSLEGTRAGYEVGTRSIIDLLAVATDYSRAEQSYHAARYAHVVARVRLKAAAGILSAADLEAINGLLRHAARP
ncbi:MAG: TolC family outer membrane protein [Betaproteobacteria bacterium]|nr:TolC family outer membrane protein [Betaproteobacteria bacterium]